MYHSPESFQKALLIYIVELHKAVKSEQISTRPTLEKLSSPQLELESSLQDPSIAEKLESLKLKVREKAEKRFELDSVKVVMNRLGFLFSLLRFGTTLNLDFDDKQVEKNISLPTQIKDSPFIIDFDWVVEHLQETEKMLEPDFGNYLGQVYSEMKKGMEEYKSWAEVAANIHEMHAWPVTILKEQRTKAAKETREKVSDWITKSIEPKITELSMMPEEEKSILTTLQLIIKKHKGSIKSKEFEDSPYKYFTDLAYRLFLFTKQYSAPKYKVIVDTVKSLIINNLILKKEEVEKLRVLNRLIRWRESFGDETLPEKKQEQVAPDIGRNLSSIEHIEIIKNALSKSILTNLTQLPSIQSVSTESVVIYRAGRLELLGMNTMELASREAV